SQGFGRSESFRGTGELEPNFNGWVLGSEGLQFLVAGCSQGWFFTEQTHRPGAKPEIRLSQHLFGDDLIESARRVEPPKAAEANCLVGITQGHFKQSGMDR